MSIDTIRKHACLKYFGFVLLTLLTGCTVEAPTSRTTASALDVRGEGARIISNEWWVVFGLGAAVFLGVMGLLAYIIYHNTRRPPELGVMMGNQREGMRWLWLGGVVLPITVLSIVVFFSLRSLVALASGPEPEVLTIEVVGHRWWWEVRYPDEGFETANQIHHC